MKKTIKIRLSFYLAILTTVTIVATSISFAVYLSLNLGNLFGEYQSNIEKLSNSLQILIIQSFRSDIEKNDFSASRKIVDILVNEKRIKYAYVVNTANNKNQVVVGNPESFKTDTDTSVHRADIKAIDRELGQDYMIYMGFPIQKMSFNVHESFSKMAYQILVFFIVLGAVASWIMASAITEPLRKLSKAAKEISEGNFNTKIQESNFEEIDGLAKSYNEMTVQLDELYSNLESKVQERTVALEEANNKLKETQAMMVHSEKMRSLGELVAGIAHEINNPVNFIHGNIIILQNYADDLFKLIDLYSQNDINLPQDFKEKVDNLKNDIDIEFLRSDIKDLIRSCKEGTERTKNIVLDLKNFSRMEEMVLTQFDIPKEIDTTLNILNNKYKNRITVVKNYSPDVPKIEAYGGQLNQVFMNILDNAQDAIAETGTLTINTYLIDDGKNVKIEFIDTGSGISPENLKKVFDPFFTTKTVGKGTGLGMSISYRVIHDHNGTITVDSEVGKGTKFTIILPVNHSENHSEEKNTETKTELS